MTELFIIEPIEKPVLNSIPPRSEVADTIVFGDISWINLAIMGKNYHDGKAKYQLSMDDANNQYTSAYPCGGCGLTIHVTLPVDTFRKKKVSIETKKNV